jgi:dipeptidyl aminopeptidase/acylaminoacyl peptidase
MGLPYPLESAVQRPSITPTAEQYKFLQSRSPIGQVQNVTAHTLVLMGSDDRRVPPSQAKVRLLVDDDQLR